MSKLLSRCGRGTVLLLGLLSLFGPSLQAQFNLDREPLGPSSRTTGLIITEIMYNPTSVSPEEELTLEYIELYNTKPWDEDISGYSIDGDVHFTFPPNTTLISGGYLVLARVPSLLESHYGISGVFGPWDGAETNRLSVEGGLVLLRNRQNAILLTVDYMDSPPWPEAADGTGHSLSLVRPSYGENDYRAWAESDSKGGSPGGPEALTQDPLASVVINEWLNHSDPVDWIELYNHSNIPVDLSGAWLSDTPTNVLFRIPDGTTIPAHSFVSWDQNQLGFQLFAGGETIFFVNPDNTRVIDVIDFRGQSNNVSSGRFPDGGPYRYGLSTPTRGFPNSPPMHYPVVINEIMYNPISGDINDEYVEIYNRSSQFVSLAGWEFIVGISYLFPTNPITMSMPPGAYWVLARNPTNLFSIYPNLNTNNTFGPYGGTLANGGERITFAAADYDIVQGGPGGSVIERLNVPVSDLIYGDGGKWGNWADGRGSSLELIDPDSDENFPSNWADSSDTAESLWTAIESDVPIGELLGTPNNDRLIIGLQGVGECLIDEIEVRVNNGPNLVSNAGFEDGLTGWTLQGSHDFSTLENTGFAGSKSLHLRAGSRGDNQSNRILSAPLTTPIPPGATRVSFRAKAKWLRGYQEILLRLHGSATEAFGAMALPRRLGSPGQPNSRVVPRTGPAIYDVKHSPVLPDANQSVVVTCRASDPQGISLLRVRYRVDPTPTYTDLTMFDDGAAGDAIPNDGIYSATIPGQAAGRIVAFYVDSRDAQNAIGTFPNDLLPPPGLDRCWPNDAVARECVIRWGEVQMPGDFATYHLWLTSANSNRWATRDTQNNTPVDGTFVYNNTRVIYEALPLYSGSPWHRTNATTGPCGSNRVDFEMNFPDDDALLGATDFVLNNCGNPNILTISDLSAVGEQTVYHIFEGLGMVHNHRRYVHFFVNGSQRSTAYERSGNFIFEDSQQPNGDMVAEWFSDGAGGQLFKVEDWFEFENNGFDVNDFNDADLARRTVTIDGQPTLSTAAYRYMFRKRSVAIGSSANDFTAIFNLIDVVSPAENPNSSTVDPFLLSTVADWEAWMRHFAVQRAVGNWDSYGWERGKNDYLYGGNGSFVHMPWDIDYSLGLGRPANEPLFATTDPRIAAMYNTPQIVRAYWRAFEDLVNGPFRNAYLDPLIDARVDALTSNNINIDLNAVASIKTYVGERRAFLQEQLATVSAPFAIYGPLTFSTNNNFVVIQGTAPVAVKEIALNGVIYPVTWTTVSNFSMRVVLAGGTNDLVLQGVDRFGADVAGAQQVLSLEYTGPVVDPAGALVFNEVLALVTNVGAQFIEIRNTAQFNFDLSGWQIEGANYTFPLGSIMTNDQLIVLARTRPGFRAVFGGLPVFDTFGSTLSAQNQTLRLIIPEMPEIKVVDALRYEGTAPWPLAEIGVSLQLIDGRQDNSRPSNWAIDSVRRSTPGVANSVAASLPAYDAVWLNEVQIESLVGPLDNMSEASPWIELYNSGDDTVDLSGYYLAPDYDGNLLEYQFPAGTLIDPGEYKLIWGDGEVAQTSGNDLHTNFRFSPQDHLALVRVVGGQPQITDYMNWNLMRPNLSYGAAPDGQPIFRSLLYDATPANINFRRALAVMINEWMARNGTSIKDPADQNNDDWFELYNGESRTIDLGGFYLTDDLNNAMKYFIPSNGQYRIPPGGYLLVWADNSPTQNRADRPDLHTSFQLSGGLGDIGLFAPDGTSLIDGISYGNQTNDVSEVRFADGARPRYFTDKETPRGPNSIAEYNSPPIPPSPPDQLVVPGQTVMFNVRAVDPDGNSLIYTLVEAPPSAALSQVGTFRWNVPANQASGTYTVRVSVVDNGTPPRTVTYSFNLIVTATGNPADPNRPMISYIVKAANQVSLTIGTTPGVAYQVFYRDDLNGGGWAPLGVTFVAANATATFTDNLAIGQRFYLVQRLP